MSTHNLSAASPVSYPERILLLDALRGFALFGVLLANLSSFGFPIMDGAQQSVATVADVLISTKFLTLFSILFGAGFYYHWQRIHENQNFKGFYLKRMFWLFVLGSIHAHLLWFGDILRIYALSGALLLLFPLQNSKKTLLWSIILMVPVTALAFIAQSVTPYLTGDYPSGEAMHYAFTQGSYREVLAMNWAIDPLRHFYKDSILSLTTTLGKMLLGVWLAKRGFFTNPVSMTRHQQRWVWGGLLVGLPSSVAYWALSSGQLEINSPALLWVPFVIAGGMVLHSLLYLSLFAGWFQRFQTSGLSRLLQSTGQMSLTNYLAQTVMGVAVFFGAGIGLAGKMTATELYAFGLSFFLLQMLASNWWLHRMAMGPVEWLWRQLTYRKNNAYGKPIPKIKQPLL